MCCRTFTPAQPNKPAASVRNFCSGAYTPKFPWIYAKGRLGWQKAVGYGMRSHAETAVFRYKTIFGSNLRARTLPAQRTETKVGCAVLNRMTSLSMPMSQGVC